MSIFTIINYENDLQLEPIENHGTCMGGLKKPAIALFGVLALIQLIINEDSATILNVIGTVHFQALKGN